MGLCASSPVASGRIDGDVVLTGVNKSDLTTIVAASLARSCGANIKMVAASGEDEAARAKFGSSAMDPLTLAALDAGKVRLDQWIQAAVGIPTEAGSDPFLEATSQLAALLAGILNKPAPPAQKKLRPAAMGELAKLEASLAAKGRLSDSWPLTHRAAVTAVLCWLLPAAEHCRWFRPVAKPGSFPLIRATQERLDTTVFVRSDTFSPPTAADLREHWAKPSVIKRGKAMGIGRLQHQSMRVWMAGLVTDAKAVQATIAAAAASPGAALLRSLMDRLGWFVELMDCHSIMEDDVIYKTIEGLAPGCTAMHTVEHIHEIPALVKLGEQMSAAVNAVTAASDGELTDDEKAELVTALETASAEAATRQEASAAEHHAMAAEAAARAESLKAAKDAAEGEAEAEGDAAATGSAPPSPSHVGVTEAEAGSRPAALAALWAACQAFVDSAPHVEAHFVGEETNLFPRLQSLSPQSHAEIFREVLSRVPRFAGGLLPFILGGLDPAQADQYLFTHRAHGKHTPEEWRSLVADVAAGVERGMLRPNKWRAILDRCTDVRKANEENEAAAAAADTEDDAVPAATPAESAVPAATPEE